MVSSGGRSDLLADLREHLDAARADANVRDVPDVPEILSMILLPIGWALPVLSRGRSCAARSRDAVACPRATWTTASVVIGVAR